MPHEEQPQLPTSPVDDDFAGRAVGEHPEQADAQGGPLAQAPLAGFPGADELGVDADAEGVEEVRGGPVRGGDPAEVDGSAATRFHGVGGGLQSRESQVGGEVVEGAGGEHGQRQSALGGPDGCRVDRPVATGDAECATVGEYVLGGLVEHQVQVDATRAEP